MNTEELCTNLMETRPADCLDVLINNEYNFMIAASKAKVRLKDGNVFFNLAVTGMDADIPAETKYDVLRKLDNEDIDVFIVSDDDEYSVIVPVTREGNLVTDEKEAFNMLLLDALIMLFEKANVKTNEDVEKIVSKAQELKYKMLNDNPF